MDKLLLTQLQQFIQKKNDELAVVLDERGLTRKDLTKELMDDPTKLDWELIQLSVGLSGLVEFVNEINYKPVDKQDWRPKDYVDALLPSVYTYAETSEAGDHLIDLISFFEKEKELPMDRKEVPASILTSAVFKDIYDRRNRIDRPASSDQGSTGPEA